MEEEISRTIRQLIDDGLEDSADKLCSLLLSSSSSASSISQSSSSLLYELQGDCAYIKEEYSRSLQLYRQSIIHGQTKKFYSIDSIEMANIHYKISQCYLKLKDKPAAIRELEIIPKELRTNKINVCLGKLYSSSELKLSATSVLKQVIKSSPLAIECMEMLVNLGVDTTEFLPKATLDNTQSNNINTICEKWISTIVQAQSAIRSSNNQEAKDKLEILLEIFPRSAYIHTMAALSAYDREEIDRCIHHFRQIRVEDSKQITGMDKYALLLYSQCLNLLSLPAVSSADQCLITLPRISGDISRMGIDVTGYREELCRLATEMMSDFPRHPISWSCAALYTDLRGDKDKAMLFIEKACTKLEPRLPMSFNIKGILFLVRDSPDQAIISFSQANSLEKNVDSYTGIAESNFQLGKHVEVLENIRNALKIRPSSSRCFTLIGRALAKANNATSRKDAIKGYRKAIRLNPSNIYPVLELSDLLCVEGQYTEAIEILVGALQKHPVYLLRCYYAKVLANLKQYDKAIQELHFAMSSSPSGSDLSLAIQEVDRIESLLQGHDISTSSDYYDPSLRSVSPTLS